MSKTLVRYEPDLEHIKENYFKLPAQILQKLERSGNRSNNFRILGKFIDPKIRKLADTIYQDSSEIVKDLCQPVKKFNKDPLAKYRGYLNKMSQDSLYQLYKNL